MKISKLLKKIVFFILFLNFISQEVRVSCEKIKINASFQSNYRLMKKKIDQNNNSTPNLTPPSSPAAPYEPEETASSLIKKAGEDLPDVPVYYQGWVKYFRYAENGEEKPKMFFKNNAFAKQQLGEDKKEEKDNVNIII